MRSMLLSLALCLLALGCATAGPRHTATMHDPEANASLEAFVRTGMDELTKGNLAWWGKTACPQALMWDADPSGAATTARGKAAIDAALGEAQKMMSSGMQLTTTTTAVQCRTTSLSGHCMVEFDQSVTQDGKTMGPFKFRGTLIAERNGEGWIWTHWHGSLAPGSIKAPSEAEAAPAAAPVAPAPAPVAPTPAPAPTTAPTPAPAPAPGPAAGAAAPPAGAATVKPSAPAAPVAPAAPAAPVAPTGKK